MKHDVRWDTKAEQELAAVWLAAADRAAVSRASAWLDGQTASSPLTLGEARESSVHRIAFHSPVGVEFEVIEDDKRVIVRAVFAIS
jgi:hypothetical protein